jgi:hypothetical protein
MQCRARNPRRRRGVGSFCLGRAHARVTLGNRIMAGPAGPSQVFSSREKGVIFDGVEVSSSAVASKSRQHVERFSGVSSL